MQYGTTIPKKKLSARSKFSDGPAKYSFYFYFFDLPFFLRFGIFLGMHLFSLFPLDCGFPFGLRFSLWIAVFPLDCGFPFGLRFSLWIAVFPLDCGFPFGLRFSLWIAVFPL